MHSHFESRTHIMGLEQATHREKKAPFAEAGSNLTPKELSAHLAGLPNDNFKNTAYAVLILIITVLAGSTIPHIDELSLNLDPSSRDALIFNRALEEERLSEVDLIDSPGLAAQILKSIEESRAKIQELPNDHISLASE